jgi:excisionase family DNA binding protein
VINPQPASDQPVRTRLLLDIPGCANYIASSVRHVRRMVAERTIPHYKVGHYIRFDPDELDEWLRQHRRGPNDSAPRPAAPVRSTQRRRPAQAAPHDNSPQQLRLEQ